jgi:hypothetical protein
VAGLHVKPHGLARRSIHLHVKPHGPSRSCRGQWWKEAHAPQDLESLRFDRQVNTI